MTDYEQQVPAIERDIADVDADLAAAWQQLAEASDVEGCKRIVREINRLGDVREYLESLVLNIRGIATGEICFP